MASVKKNILYNSANQLLVALAPLITTPYLSRMLGAEGNGIFTYTESIATYFVLVAAMGMSTYGVRTIAANADDREKRSRVFWEAFTMQAMVGVVVLTAYVVYATVWGREYLTLWLLWGMWVLGSVLDVTWLLYGMQEFRVPSVLHFCTRLASVVLIFVLVRRPEDVWGYVAAIAGQYTADALFVWPHVHKYVDFVLPTWRGVVSHLVPNLVLFVPVIATSLYTIMDKVMLGAMAGMGQTGYYAYAEKASKMPTSVVVALGSVMLPKMATVIAAGRDDEARGLVGTAIWFMEACAFALAFGIAAVAPEFVPVFLGEGYAPCVPLLRTLCATVPLICATNVMGVQWLLPTNRDRVFTVSVAAGAVVNIAINAFAIPIVGALGASVATVAAELAVLVLQSRAVRSDLPLGTYLRGALPFLAMGAAMYAAIRALSHAMGPHASTIPGLLAEIVCGGAIYVALSYAWCRAVRSPELKRVLPRLVRW